jgi:uncharacterized protein (UPF0332 family)
LPDDLIDTARRLARANPGRPRQADLKRAVSTAYYALFHALARQCADLLIGVGQNRSDPAWTQVYRSLEHGIAKNACKAAANTGFPGGIVTFANTFISMQEKRHSADYNPDARYTQADVLLLIRNAEQAIASLKGEPRKDRRAFAVSVLMQKKR